jgi:hypothetical protein
MDHTTARVNKLLFMGSPPAAEGAVSPHDSFFAREKVLGAEQLLGSGTHAR